MYLCAMPVRSTLWTSCPPAPNQRLISVSREIPASQLADKSTHPLTASPSFPLLFAQYPVEQYVDDALSLLFNRDLSAREIVRHDGAV